MISGGVAAEIAYIFVALCDLRSNCESSTLAQTPFTALVGADAGKT